MFDKRFDPMREGMGQPDGDPVLNRSAKAVPLNGKKSLRDAESGNSPLPCRRSLRCSRLKPLNFLDEHLFVHPSLQQGSGTTVEVKFQSLV